MPSEGKFQQKAFAPLVLPVKGIGWPQPCVCERLSFSARRANLRILPAKLTSFLPGIVYLMLFILKKNNDVRYVTTVN